MSKPKRKGYPLGHGLSLLAPGSTDTWETWGCHCGVRGYGSSDWRTHLYHNGIEMTLKRTKWAKRMAKLHNEKPRLRTGANREG